MVFFIANTCPAVPIVWDYHAEPPCGVTIYRDTLRQANSIGSLRNLPYYLAQETLLVRPHDQVPRSNTNPEDCSHAVCAKATRDRPSHNQTHRRDSGT